MKIILLTPPMTQLNTPYPATAYLSGFLKTQGYHVSQYDPGLELALKLFSENGLHDIYQIIRKKNKSKSRSIIFFLKNFSQYESTVESVIAFLQNNDHSLAYRIIRRDFLPEGPRYDQISDIENSHEFGLGSIFGSSGIYDHAKFLASLYIDDIADVIQQGIDPQFQLSRYGEKLAASQKSFSVILKALHSKPTLIAQYIDQLTEQMLEDEKPDFIGMSLPFPGNVFGAFRMAQKIKSWNKKTKIALGGGYVNTELRDLKDPRVFDFVDFISLDDGEMPLLQILESIKGKNKAGTLLRTMIRENSEVKLISDPSLHDVPFKKSGTPTYGNLPLKKYLSLLEMLNPMHRIWSDGRWNKLTLAHGCYWAKCNFCDVSLDYIGRYESSTVDSLIQKIEHMIEETGSRGFHFVDEAAPPILMAEMAKKLIEKKIQITWWGNIRFEKTFNQKLTELLAQSGCIAMSGGLEVASNRLLQLMNKGVSVEQVAQVTKNFCDSGILVHAYLMYGFPSQTVQETIDSLERVRQLFAEGCIQSAFWHRFSATVHSPIGKNPEKFGIKIFPKKSTFAQNDLAFEDSTGCDHDQFTQGLNKAIFNYMYGVGLEEDVRTWFDIPLPKPKVDHDFIKRSLKIF